MKDFAVVCAAALLIGGFYALGSNSLHHYMQTDQSIVRSANVIDTVPKKKDTMDKRRDTTGRKDTLQRPGLPK